MGSVQARKRKGGHLADRFELKSQAGTGGMGTVYQAVDLTTQQLVAVKVLHGKGASDADRFHQEAALLAELSHPAIVRYIDNGVTRQGEAYIAMEWLEGETLEERLARGPLPPGLVARLAQRLLGGLAAAHARGVIHRDMKPSNVFLTAWRIADAKILDFGIARRVFDSKRFTRAGATVGTPMYSAPEQARGDRSVDARADIFSLGCVLFECLVGEAPFVDDTPAKVMAKVCLGTAPSLAARLPSLDGELTELVQQMLTQDRAARPGQAAVLADRFAAVAERLDTDEAAPSVIENPRAARDTLSDGEQRVMALLLIAAADRGSGPARRSPGTHIMAALRPPLRVAAPASSSAITAEIASAPEVSVPPAAAPVLTPADLAPLGEALGGRCDRLLDGSVVVTVPQLSNLKDQVEQIARIALRLQQAAPEARLSLASGPGVLLARLPVGDVVEAAAARLETTEAGRIGCDDLSARLLGTHFRIERDPGGAYLGYERTAGAWLLQEWPNAARFVGRERELASLVALLKEAGDESVARIGVVVAPPGFGKTRLASELVRRTRDRARVVALRGLPVRGAGLYGALEPLLREAGVDADARTPVTAIRDALVQHLKTTAATAQAEGKDAVLLVVDDAQHLDLASVQLLDATVRGLASVPLVLLVLGRPETEDRFPGLFAERSPARLRLAALGRKALEALLADALPVRKPEAEEWIAAHAEGSPFFLLELARLAARDRVGELPPGLLGVGQSRFEALGPDGRRVLRACALLGQNFDPDDLIPLLGERARRGLPDLIALLCDKRVLVRMPGATGELSFLSPLLRELAYATLAPGDRALGRRVARRVLDAAGRTLPEFLLAGRSAVDTAAAGSVTASRRVG